MKFNPSLFRPGGEFGKFITSSTTEDYPVENVSWYDAIQFCNRLSEQDGISPYYRVAKIKKKGNGTIDSADVSLTSKHGYRLLTEAEWEYACRAESVTRFNCGDEITFRNARIADVVGAGLAGTKVQFGTNNVASFGPNSFGLYDMHGNVSEWCHDKYAIDYESLGTTDPLNLDDGADRVCRGGSWLESNLGEVRSASRKIVASSYTGPGIGIRIAKDR